MRNFIQHKTFGIKWTTILLGMVFLINHQDLHAQYISLNGAYVSIGSGTVVGTDTVNNNSSTTFANAGTVTLKTIINAGTKTGDICIRSNRDDNTSSCLYLYYRCSNLSSVTINGNRPLLIGVGIFYRPCKKYQIITCPRSYRHPC